jgi:hypothetical protein
LVEFDAVELRKQAVAQHFDRDPGTVGDEEHGSTGIGHEKGAKRGILAARGMRSL